MNRDYGNTYHHVPSQQNSPCTVRNTPNTGNNPVNVLATQSPNNSNIESLQSEILGLQTWALQQSTLNSINIFDGNNKSEFTLWAQSVENAAKLCNLVCSPLHYPSYRDPHLNQLISLNPKKLAQVSS